MYGNVVELMAIFVGVFTLVDVNVCWASANLPVTSAIALNLSAVGGMSALAGLITLIVEPKAKQAKTIPWIVSVIAFLAAAIVALLH